MSLDWNVKNCKNPDELMKEGNWEVTQGIIFGCMITGIGEITEKTAGEWYARYKVIANLKGFTPYTRAEVNERIGLKTNVFGVESRAKWLKRHFDRILDEYANKA